MAGQLRQLAPFDFQPRTRIVFGAGAAERTGPLARELGGTRVLLVSDPGIAAAGHEARIRRSLEASDLAVAVFDGVRPNPTTRDVDQCLAVARAAPVDLIVGLGGGSAMDTAKGCNFLLTNGGQMRDYWGVGKATRPMLPMIAIPTTAGTGSETQSYALIADEVTHRKMACGDVKAAPRVALLDPTLTLTQPRRVTACTGIDALSHAVETAVTRRRNPLSQVLSREAFALIVCSFEQVLRHPDDLAARGHMQLGAALAGLAIETSMLGAAHAAANPLTARHDVVHGQAVGLMLPWVVRFNLADPEACADYAGLLRTAGLVNGQASAVEAATALARRIEGLLDAADLPASLAECGVRESHLGQLADEAATQWTAGFNPRPLTAEDFAALYRQALQPRG